MTIKYKLPDLGEDIETGDVIDVFVSAGDKVEQDQSLIEIETDKAAVEIPAPAGGTIKEVHVKEGDSIKVGQLLVTIDDGKESSSVDEEDSEDESTEEEKETETKEESQEETEDEEIEETAEKEAEKEMKDDPEPEPEETKKSEDSDDKDSNEEAQEDEENGDKENEDEEKTKKESDEKSSNDAKKTKDSKSEDSDSKKSVPASPSVRRIARELDVNINQVKGTGPGGRISEEDVRNHKEGKKTKSKSKPKAPEPEKIKETESSGESSQDKWGETDRTPMSKVRRLTAERLTEAWKAPHVTQYDKADITELEKLRKEFGPEVEKAGGKLTVTSIMVKVIASALKAFPEFNASVDMENSEIIYKKYYNVGVAVDTDRGLLVPVIKDAMNKNITELSVELSEISEKARDKKISVDELQGGTFTISNLGGIGGTYFSPVLNAPEVAILGISRSVIEPVYIDGGFLPRMMLPLSLSYDHRLIDGADAIRFLRWVIEALEEPFKITLEG